MLLLELIIWCKHLTFPYSPVTRMRTSGHAFKHSADKNMLYFKNVFHSHSQPPKIYFYSYKSKFNSHMFRGSSFLSSFNLSFYHIVASSILGVSRKGTEEKSSDSSQFGSCFTHKEQYRSRKTLSFTSSYF